MAPDQVLRLGRDGTAQVEVAPWRGAKIVSLRGPNGEEWLAQPSAGLLDSRESGLAFTDAEMCGWDECAPTIDACVLPDGTTVRDHGDLWDQSWDVRLRGGAITCLVRGRDWPYAFRRTISVDGSAVRMDYEVTSQDSVPRPLLWAAHPQFAAPSGSRVELGDGRQMVLTTEQPPVPVLWQDTDVDLPDGSCAKWWPQPDDAVRCAVLHRPGGSRLTLRTAGEAVRWVGVWSDAAVYARERVIALEPATGWFDDAATAAIRGHVLMLEPGAKARWSLHVELWSPG